MFFRFPPDARWNTERSAVEFSIGVGEYEGTVCVPRRVFQRMLGVAPTPQRCLEAYHLDRTRLELVAERKVRRSQLADDGNVEITGRDFRERGPRSPVGAVAYRPVARMTVGQYAARRPSGGSMCRSSRLRSDGTTRI
jgi:hypothetical protein